MEIILEETRTGNKFQSMDIRTNKIRILLLYIIYPLAIGSYYRKALEHRDDVDLKVAGVYTSNWIPWGGTGMNVPMKYAIPPDISLPFSPDVREVNYEIVRPHLGDWTPDIIINVDANLHWKYKPTDGYIVTVGTDPHVLNDFYDVPRAYSDKFFNMQLCYSKSGDIYLPYAYSSYDHYPIHIDGLEDGTWKDKDAVLIGMPYENRVQWINELRKRGISVIFENGPIFDEARVLYNRGRIGLNWSTLQDLNARCFELPAMKLAPVINLVPDAGLFFEQGIHYAGFTNLQEAVERVVWLKEHPHELDEMANEAYRNVQGQTYDSRVQKILKEGGFA